MRHFAGTFAARHPEYSAPRRTLPAISFSLLLPGRERPVPERAPPVGLHYQALSPRRLHHLVRSRDKQPWLTPLAEMGSRKSEFRFQISDFRLLRLYLRTVSKVACVDIERGGRVRAEGHTVIHPQPWPVRRAFRAMDHPARRTVTNLLRLLTSA